MNAKGRSHSFECRVEVTQKLFGQGVCETGLNSYAAMDLAALVRVSALCSHSCSTRAFTSFLISAIGMGLLRGN
jgi:hypothetical protein